MVRMLLNVWHDLGTGRAIDNARRDRDELERTIAAVDALVARVAAAVPAHEPLAA